MPLSHNKFKIPSSYLINYLCTCGQSGETWVATTTGDQASSEVKSWHFTCEVIFIRISLKICPAYRLLFWQLISSITLKGLGNANLVMQNTMKHISNKITSISSWKYQAKLSAWKLTKKNPLWLIPKHFFFPSPTRVTLTQWHKTPIQTSLLFAIGLPRREDK